MSLQLLNRLSKLRSRYTPFDNLEVNCPHNIQSFEKLDNNGNNWGSRVRINLEDGRYLVLPIRFNHLLKGDQLKKMNKEKLCLIYKGKENSYLSIFFKPQLELKNKKIPTTKTKKKNVEETSAATTSAATTSAATNENININDDDSEEEEDEY